MTSQSPIWKWISGVLASLLLVATTFAITDHSTIAVIQEQQTNQNQIIEKLANNQSRVLDLLAHMEEQIKHLEEGK